ILRSILNNLDYIHQKYIHSDLHSKNILMFSIEDFIPRAFDLNGTLIMIQANVGAKQKKHDIQKYGVLSYLAPEVILKKQYTKASDIYSLGAIMLEVSTGRPPFINMQNEEDYILMQEIIKASRPKFGPGTPDCYVNLANQHVYEKFQDWEIILDKNIEELTEEQIEIRDAFSKADNDRKESNKDRIETKTDKNISTISRLQYIGNNKFNYLLIICYNFKLVKFEGFKQQFCLSIKLLFANLRKHRYRIRKIVD
ncbi:17435_t:CDS:2, partial [Racocetra fulgida]